VDAAAGEAAAASLTIDQLAARAGLTVRNVRAHITRGLLPPPRMQGRTAHYGPEHLARLQLVVGLQQQGFNLAAIRKLVSGPAAPSPEETVAFYRTALGPWLTDAPEDHDEQDLAAQFGIAPDQEVLRRLAQLGLLEPLPKGRVRVLNPTILRVGRELAEMGFSLEQLTDVLAVLLRHSRAVSEAFVQMFMETHWTSYLDAGAPPERLPELARVIQALQPLAAQAVVAAFQQEMTQATSSAFDRTAINRDTDGDRSVAG
jgi:DNA-binding transcriptional MerR regulator